MSELKPCPHCGEEPIEHAIEAHKHCLVNLPDYPGSYVIECVCGAGSIGDTRDEAKAKWNRRAQPAQAGQVLTDDRLLAMWEGTDGERALRPTLGKNKILSFARAIEQAVLAKRVPMTESAWQNPLHPDQISDKPIPNWTPLYRLMSKISDPNNAQHFSAEAARKAFDMEGKHGL